MILLSKEGWVVLNSDSSDQLIDYELQMSIIQIKAQNTYLKRAINTIFFYHYTQKMSRVIP